jgi:hypothetical protein
LCLPMRSIIFEGDCSSIDMRSRDEYGAIE